MVDHFDIDSFLEEDSISPWIGCVTDRGIPKGYWKNFDVYEQSHQDLAAKGSTLKKWTVDLPEDRHFIARLDPQLVMHADLLKPEGSDALNKLLHTCAVRSLALRSQALLLHTPAQFRPSSENERRIIHAFKLIKSTLNEQDQHPHLIWRADGLWEESESYFDLCTDQHIIPCIDPLMWDEEDPLPQGERYYWRLLGQKGLSTRLSDFDLDRLVEMSAEMQKPGWLIFASPHMMSVAKKCRSWFE